MMEGAHCLTDENRQWSQHHHFLVLTASLGLCSLAAEAPEVPADTAPEVQRIQGCGSDGGSHVGERGNASVHTWEGAFWLQ
jgi:hypothetical protein